MPMPMPGTFNPTHPFNPYVGDFWSGQPRNAAEWAMMARMDRTPQDIQPADPDESRFYPVRELNGALTMRNRHTIDNYLQPVRWHRNYDGTFYAERLRKD
jgi:hypothetical protein